jgi:hypothetical protein
MASPRLALPRLTCRLKGKKGVNRHTSPYRLKNYADGYSCPSTRAIFVFIVIFSDRSLAARPYRLFDLQRHDRRQTSPSGGRSVQCPSAGEHHPQLHQLRQLT